MAKYDKMVSMLKGNTYGKANKGRKLSAEWKDKIGSANKGNVSRRGKWSPELEAIDPRPNPKGRGLWLTILINSKRQKALQRGLKWSLTKVQAALLLKSKCHYCGFLGDIDKMGIDRRDNTIRDYTPQNSVPCCWGCNKLKQRKTEAEFMVWLQNKST